VIYCELRWYVSGWLMYLTYFFGVFGGEIRLWSELDYVSSDGTRSAYMMNALRLISKMRNKRMLYTRLTEIFQIIHSTSIWTAFGARRD